MTGYIQHIREKVGHDVVIQCGASVIIVNEKNEVLLQKRGDNHMWAYHGGSVEVDEDVEETARRELFEETGLTAGKMTFLGVFSGPDMHFIYPNGDEVSNVDVVYVCRDFSGEIRPQEREVLELKYFPIDHLPEEISPPNARALRTFVREQGAKGCPPLEPDQGTESPGPRRMHQRG